MKRAARQNQHRLKSTLYTQEKMLRLAYGDRRYLIFDQVILDESVYLRPLGHKISREELYHWPSPPKEEYIEGNPRERSEALADVHS